MTETAEKKQIPPTVKRKVLQIACKMTNAEINTEVNKRLDQIMAARRKGAQNLALEEETAAYADVLVQRINRRK